MIKITALCATLAICLVASGCATESMLPTSSATANFNGAEGKTGWSKYEHVETFRGYTADQIYEAAKVGLGESGFSLRRADKNAGVVIGEHGMTLHDWNVLAGVYFEQTATDTIVKVIAQGSKDTGISGDVTGSGWTGMILGRMRHYLNDTYQSILKINKDSIK